MPDSLKHKPNRFDSYRSIHDTFINRFQSRGFIGESTLEFKGFLGDIVLSGEIACKGNIVITVCKTLVILSGSGNSAIVQTDSYEYNASVRGYGNFLRYDNSHSRQGHSDNHHRHEFDWRLNEQTEGKVTWVGEGSWLTLGEVIEEVEQWYWDNYNDLPQPHAYPKLGLSQVNFR